MKEQNQVLSKQKEQQDRTIKLLQQQMVRIETIGPAPSHFFLSRLLELINHGITWIVSWKQLCAILGSLFGFAIFIKLLTHNSTAF